MTTIYSFRAECPVDVASFILAVNKFNEDIKDEADLLTVERPTMAPLFADEKTPEMTLEFESTGTLDELRDVLRSISDGHVMLQTLRPCLMLDNSLERDYDLE